MHILKNVNCYSLLTKEKTLLQTVTYKMTVIFTLWTAITRNE